VNAAAKTARNATSIGLTRPSPIAIMNPKNPIKTLPSMGTPANIPAANPKIPKIGPITAERPNCDATFCDANFMSKPCSGVPLINDSPSALNVSLVLVMVVNSLRLALQSGTTWSVTTSVIISVSVWFKLSLKLMVMVFVPVVLNVVKNSVEKLAGAYAVVVPSSRV